MNTQTKEYPIVVQQIHNEFNLAGERLLAESLAIIQKANDSSIKKGESLNLIGFNNAKELHELKRLINQKNDAVAIANSIQAYLTQFRGYKFISYDNVAEINKKYNLVLGGIEAYKGFVPEKNLNEVSRFKSNFRLENKRYTIEKLDLFQWINIIPRSKWEFKRYLKSINSTIVATSDYAAERILEDKAIEISEKTGRNGYHSGYIRVHGVTFKEHSPFMICAPKSDMVSSLLNFEVNFAHIPDPVVLYPVEHGYIIVTAWGDEATDPLVLNEKLN